MFDTNSCSGCDARDAHIISLKDEIIRLQNLIEELQFVIARDSQKKDDVISHLTGMNRAANPRPAGEMHSIPRTNTIRDRIRRAEQSEAADVGIKAKRESEYQDRLNRLMNPEIEVVNDAL